MNNISITIDEKIVSRWLSTRPEKLKGAVSNIINKVTLLTERYAKILTPVDTGRLRSSISSQIRPMSSTVSTHTNYARYVHDGTRYMSPRPFMRQGADQALGQMSGIVDAEVKNALE